RGVRQPDTHTRIDPCDGVLLEAAILYRLQECRPQSGHHHRSIEEHRRAEPFATELRQRSMDVRAVVVIARNPGWEPRGKGPVCENRNLGAEPRHEDTVV